MISYVDCTYKGRPAIRVYLDKRRVGLIFEVPGGFAYAPNGGKPGETFHNVAQVKRSLQETA